MPIALLPTLLLQILIVGYSPGPANIFALAMSLRHGRKTALFMWLGLLLGFSLAACTLALLTHFVGEAFGQYIVYLKYVGAAYLAYLAFRIWRTSDLAAEQTRDCTFLNGMIVQMTNAKILLFDLTVFSTFVLPYSHSLLDLFIACAWLVLAGPGANLVWLLVGSTLAPFFKAHARVINRLSAIALFLCALWVLL